MDLTIVIVGANLAGGSAAATLRQEGFDGRVVLIGEEPDLPYERPPLSKEYLRGETTFDQALFREAGFYEENQIETLLATRARRVDVEGTAVELDDGNKVEYDRLLVATGGRNRSLDVPGSGLEGVFDLRTRRDADRIQAAAARATSAVVVGMGFIGAEVAASLRTIGLDVTAIEIFSVPLERILGADLGAVVAQLHRDHGVELVTSETVVGFRGSDQVEEVVTRSGKRFEADLVIVGVGIVPNTAVVEGSRIAVENGILVDEFCRTNVEGVFAAGDVANHFHPLASRRMRVEHWQNALRQGAAAARNMLGTPEPYADVHWFWSDQYDSTIQHAGFHGPYDQRVVRGSVEDRDFIAFDLREGRLTSAVAFGRRREIRAVMKLIEAGELVEPNALADEDVDLRTLSSGHG